MVTLSAESVSGNGMEPFFFWLWRYSNRLSLPEDVPNLKEDKHTTVEMTESAGPSRDGVEDQIQDARRTPSPVSPSLEDELVKEDKMETTSEALPKSDPLFQWDDDIQPHKFQVLHLQKTPMSLQKFKAAPSSSTLKVRPGEKLASTRSLLSC